MVVMFNGRPTDGDRVTMQRLHRVNVIHAFMVTFSDLPDITCLHKRVEVEMADGTLPAHKFTNLCREVMMLVGTGGEDRGKASI